MTLEPNANCLEGLRASVLRYTNGDVEWYHPGNTGRIYYDEEIKAYGMDEEREFNFQVPCEFLKGVLEDA